MLIREESRSIPVFHEADICVLGGSCTGVFAAVRAARLDAKVVLVEKQNAFGGVAASGLVNIWHSLFDAEFKRQIIAGLTLETVERLKRVDGITERRDSPSAAYVLNTEELKIELDRLVLEAGVIPCLHTLFAAPLVKNGELEAVIVENKSGRGAIRAKLFIDATGDGDLCHRLGLEEWQSLRFQPSTACAKISGWGRNGAWEDDITGTDKLAGLDLREALLRHKDEFGIPEGFGWGSFVPGSRDVYMYAGTRIYHADSADGESLTASEIEGRRQVRAIMDMIRKYGPENRLALIALPSSIGTRETRHISSRYRLTGEDVLSGRLFEDAIANGSCRVDIHHQDKPGLTFKYLDGRQVYVRPGYPQEEGRWRETSETNPTFYQIPYRSLLPSGPHPNVIAAGRMLDADEVAFGGVRVMVNLNQVGEAAGTAAYIALSEPAGFRGVDPLRLRSLLAAGGSIMI